MGKCCTILFCKILVQECECSVQFLSYNLSEDLKQSSSFPRHFSYRVSFISRWMLSQKERKIVNSFYFACKKKFMLNIFRFERFLKWNFPFKLNQQKEQIMNTKKYVNILLRVNALLNFSLFFFVIVPYSVLFATCWTTGVRTRNSNKALCTNTTLTLHTNGWIKKMLTFHNIYSTLNNSILVQNNPKNNS